jgi:hypothetical protein
MGRTGWSLGGHGSPDSRGLAAGVPAGEFPGGRADRPGWLERGRGDGTPPGVPSTRKGHSMVSLDHKVQVQPDPKRGSSTSTRRLAVRCDCTGISPGSDGGLSGSDPLRVNRWRPGSEREPGPPPAFQDSSVRRSPGRRWTRPTRGSWEFPHHDTKAGPICLLSSVRGSTRRAMPRVSPSWGASPARLPSRADCPLAIRHTAATFPLEAMAASRGAVNSSISGARHWRRRDAPGE